MDVADEGGLRQREEVVVAPEVARVVGEPLATILGFTQAMRLNSGSHGPVEHQDTLFEQSRQQLAAFRESRHQSVSPV